MMHQKRQKRYIGVAKRSSVRRGRKATLEKWWEVRDMSMEKKKSNVTRDRRDAEGETREAEGHKYGERSAA